MKKLTPLLLCGLLAVPIVARAQSYDAAHKIKAAEFSKIEMPKLTRQNAVATSDVLALQYLLRNRGFYRAKVDGEFGSQTEKAVRDFQRAKGLKVDGIVGPQTWPVLLLRLKRGDRGDAVRALQIQLRALQSEVGTLPFIGLPVDGIYGAQTEKVVRSFQGEWMPYYGEKTKVDGVVGAQTWGGLFGAKFAD